MSADVGIGMSTYLDLRLLDVSGELDSSLRNASTRNARHVARLVVANRSAAATTVRAAPRLF